jgi:hypothetical protein
VNGIRQEYVDARRVLLDALAGLHAHLDAFVLIGAQAVYLRTIDRLPGYQPFTTDADLVFDPELLADSPLLADAMTSAGFVFSGQPGIWHRIVAHPGVADVTIPVDRCSRCPTLTVRLNCRLAGGKWWRHAGQLRTLQCHRSRIRTRTL